MSAEARPGTFSIVALDPQSGEIGVAVASKFLAVGAAVPWAQAGAGGIATQAWANLSYGPQGLRLLASGEAAEAALQQLVGPDGNREHRQVGIVDARGRTAAWTGRECLPWAGHRLGEGFTCQGNILVGPDVVEAMAGTFARTPGPLPERLLAALAAGQRAGGDSRGQQSAALLVVKEGGSYGGYLDRYIDLRVDDHPAPVEELQRLLTLHRLYFPAAQRTFTELAGETAREVQRILRRLGYYKGEVTGIYDDATREAFRRFCSVENFEERWRQDHLVDREVLHYLRRRYGAHS
ncbi:MAG: DUF1028 domain-containing protein [Armatimonadota bacterium]|nr:DUF1028 domain-containing protein [Armatimonadota bacterium]MDR7426290.1 DUF1028 domain-containing protein [Armatimonadota bacterium]MDR7465203.1 DUF1028 domain-containing protein [Armatimonadota bacterium]MDR7470868.1 DUF1028 domain-containing protein [Armatimonadota bacterium]MDR7474709.1 DUF1028 domain-containing protein [Armatimonadota bacterium]